MTINTLANGNRGPNGEKHYIDVLLPCLFGFEGLKRSWYATESEAWDARDAAYDAGAKHVMVRSVA